MIKKLFDWTPRDIAFWEAIRQKGLRRFIGWYGVIIIGGLLFILIGLVTFIFWLRQVTGQPISNTSLLFLAGQLLVVAVVCILAGLANALITWVVEERLYRKFKART